MKKRVKEGNLRVWWIPQVPMKSFYVDVDSPKQAAFLMNALAEYDLFQLANNVKPDYSNAGGLEVFKDGEWVEWEDDEGQNIDDWKDSKESKEKQE